MTKKFLLAITTCLVFTACASTNTDDIATNTDIIDGIFTPSQAINLIIPYEAGGNSDIPARIMVQYMNEAADTEIKITNIVGAGGRTGFSEMLKSNPDGYTLSLHSSGFIMQHALGIADFTYEDAQPIGYLLDSTMAVVVSADSPYHTMDDLINAAKSAPGTIKIGSVTGTLPLFGVLQIEQEKDVEFHKVDLGVGSKSPELLGGRIDGYVDGFGAVKQYIDSGDFRCLGIISDTEQPGYEDIPTFAELGFENYAYLKQDFGLWAPLNTPEPVLQYVNNLIQEASNNPECIEELANISFQPKYMDTSLYIEELTSNYIAFDEAAAAIIQ
ncbi:tripartite tricarboxylate transporter substrate binding protein [Candidatus Epulonipiscium viviparus]|uniref:tripartite tricarboxylate transporter substrate binding protein n=1 Tax=Candidatus Epulonipiscium viviparus TaxID=420336 RepID=UPI00016C0F27|nr:tripartite tricarboxylate transporter substrate binding protein [Candidatus Epulopiscium viviparus]